MFCLLKIEIETEELFKVHQSFKVFYFIIVFFFFNLNLVFFVREKKRKLLGGIGILEKEKEV